MQQLILRQILDAKFGMFTYSEEARTSWFNSVSTDFDEFKLIGIVWLLYFMATAATSAANLTLCACRTFFRFWDWRSTTASFWTSTFRSWCTRSSWGWSPLSTTSRTSTPYVHPPHPPSSLPSALSSSTERAQLIRSTQQGLAQGLRKLLEFDGNVEETFMQNFQISYEAYGMVQTHDLKDGGADIPLTNENRQGMPYST
jgi:hypothetical protein